MEANDEVGYIAEILMQTSFGAKRGEGEVRKKCLTKIGIRIPNSVWRAKAQQCSRFTLARSFNI